MVGRDELEWTGGGTSIAVGGRAPRVVQGEKRLTGEQFDRLVL